MRGGCRDTGPGPSQRRRTASPESQLAGPQIGHNPWPGSFPPN